MEEQSSAASSLSGSSDHHLIFFTERERPMADDAFAFDGMIPPAQPEEHRREAIRIRTLAPTATTERMRRHLEDRARQHERLAGDRRD